MKKLILLLFCMILLVGTVSAWEWDNVKSYDKEARTIKITNAFGLGKDISTIKLDTPKNVYVIRGKDRKVAEFTINNVKNYKKVFNRMEFYNIKKSMKRFDREFVYKYEKSLGFETIDKTERVCEQVYDERYGELVTSCRYVSTGKTEQVEKFEWIVLDTSKDLPEGETTIGIFIDVYAGDNVEWIPTLFGVEIDEWAVWTEGLKLGLLRYFALNESSADTAIDSTSTADGVLVDPVNVTGIIGSAYNFTAVGDYVYTNNLNLTGTWTISHWIKIPVTDAHSSTMWAINGNFLQGLCNTTNYVGFGLYNGTWYGTYGNETISDNTWYHYVAIYDVSDGSRRLYVDGELAINDKILNVATAGTLINLTFPTYNQAVKNIFIDEIGIWNRTLSVSEVEDLYNGGSGITYTTQPLPTVTLHTPANDDDFLIPTIEFNCTASDDTGITNVSLVINGTIKQTNSSGYNNTWIEFTETITTGTGFYNWTCQAYDNDDALTVADARNFTYSNDLAVSLNSPINAFNSTLQTIRFNGTGQDDTSLINVSFILNATYNGTNSSVFNATLTNFDRTLADGFRNWTLETCDNLGACVNATAWNFTIDTTFPTVNITHPLAIVDYHLGEDPNQTLNWTATDDNLDSCWYNYDFTNRTVTCNVNTTNITLTAQRNVTFWANDTFGIYNSDYQEWEYTVFENSQTFNNETLEGHINTFIANVTIEESTSISIAYFIYNETSTIGSFSQSGNYSILTIDFLASNVNADTNLTFFWSLLLSDDQIINLTSYNQTVYPISLDDCSVNTVVLYNYTIVDEKNQSRLTDPVNTTAELNINLLDLGRQIYIFNFSLEYSKINPFGICISEDLLYSTYVVDSIVKYEAINYSIEYYNILNATITNSTIPENITLYDLVSSDATEFKITFKAEDFTFVENALIYIDRQYIAENNTFKTVELPKTDSNGQTIGHFVRNDVVYNIRVIKDGVVLGNFKNIIAFCEDYIIGNCQMVLEATPEDFTIFDYDEQLGIIFQSIPTYNEITSAISFDFSTDDGTVKTVLMEVTRDDIFGNRSICNNTITSSSGTLSCSFDPNIDNSVLRVNIFVDEQPIVFSSVTLESSDYGNLGYVLWFFLTFLFILLFAHSKTEILIGLAISFIGAIALGITRGNVIGLGSAGIWVLVIVILGIWKLNKEKPQ